MFSKFEADVNWLVGWHRRATALETNRERRKMAFSTFFRWRSWGVGGRDKFPKCVEVGIRCCFPSTFYMGFHEDDDQRARRQAVNMLGKFVDAWWVWRHSTWELEETQIIESLNTRIINVSPKHKLDK